MPYLQLYGPTVGAIIFLVFAISFKFNKTLLFPIKTPIFETTIPITNRTVGRLIFVLAAFLCLSYYFFLDFKEFFPKHIEMEVFYDQKGIDNSLSVFTSEELNKLGFDRNNMNLCNIYYDDLNKKLKEIIKVDQFFSLSDAIVHSKGETSFKIEKISGFQNYYITESKGELVHTMEKPNQPQITFKSFFEKQTTVNDYIKPSIADILLKQSVILSPRFKQLLAEQNKADGALFDHAVVGVTKVFILPFPKFSNTVYFCDLPKKGLVPIGYAVYR